MTPVPPDPAQKPAVPRSGNQSRTPFVVLLLIFGVLTARWIWIAGITDYAWIYELGERVRLGEVPYRDFICTLPQLTSYTLVPFLALLKGHLWGFALHLYLWWLASLWMGLLVARQLGLSVAWQSAAIFLAACISFPPVGLGHAYSYAGTFCFALVLRCLLRHAAEPKAVHLLLAGAGAGLALLAKQNLGMVAAGLGLISLLLPKHSPGSHRRSVVIDGVVFSAGLAATFLPAFAYFASHAGAKEVWLQMFTDAGAGKGGIDRMLANVLPLVPFNAESPDYLLWSLPMSGLLSLGFLAWFGYLTDIGQARHGPSGPPAPAQDTDPALARNVAFGVVVLVSVVSLFNLPSWRSGFDSAVPRFFYGYIGPLVGVLYAAMNAFGVISLANLWLRKRFELLLPAAALALILWGHEISAHGYLVYSAPLAVPLAFSLAQKQFVSRRAVSLAYVLGAVFVFTHAVFPYKTYRLGTFEGLHRLPNHTRFANLWAASSYAGPVNELLTNVSSRIQDRGTLWVAGGGPHLAFGGAPVRSVAALHFDTYHARSEPALMEEWNRQPPEFVFLGYYVPCVGSRYLTREALRPWLQLHYQCVWQSTRHELSLWELKAKTQPAAN
jgi:hypothetical protein